MAMHSDITGKWSRVHVDMMCWKVGSCKSLQLGTLPPGDSLVKISWMEVEVCVWGGRGARRWGGGLHATHLKE